MIPWLLLVPVALSGTLSGTVYDDAGNPLSGITVVAYDARLAYLAESTNSRGVWQLDDVPAGPYRIRAAPADDSGYVDQFLPDTWDYCTADRIVVGEADEVGGLDFYLPTGGALAVRLLDPDGSPVADAAVVAEGLSARTSLGLRVTYSDEEGRFTLVGLDSDPGSPEPWRCFVDVDGYPQQFFGPTYEEDDASTFDLAREDTLELEDQTLLAGISVEGTVRGPTGPVTGGTVYVYASSQALATSIEADGTYVGDGLPPGDVIAWADSPGYAVTYYPDADRPGASVPAKGEGTTVRGVDLEAPYESTFTVQFTGNGDTAEVSVLVYNSTFTVGRGSPVDPHGRVTIDGLFPGEYTMFVYGSDGGFEDAWAADESGEPRVFAVDGDTEVEVALATGASVSGQVTDDQGAPVYGAYVTALGSDGESGDTVVTAADGTYAIVGLVAEVYTVQAWYVNYCPSDGGYVGVWWQGSLVPETAASLQLASGAAEVGVDFVLPIDDDHDAMGDTWEDENGLDPERDDAAEDPDGDGIVNVDEYLLGTDPTGSSLGGGCCEGKAAGVGWLFAGWWWTRRRR